MRRTFFHYLLADRFNLVGIPELETILVNQFRCKILIELANLIQSFVRSVHSMTNKVSLFSVC